MFRVKTITALAALGAALMIAAPAPAAAQYDAKLQSFRTKEEITAHIRRAQHAEELLISEERRLTAQIDALSSVRGPYIVKTGDIYRSLGDNEVEPLAALAGLMGISYEIGALPPNVGAGSQIAAALQTAVDMVKTQSQLGRSSSVDPADLAQVTFRSSLDAITQKNREAIHQEVERLRAQLAQSRRSREVLADFVELMLARRDNASDESALAGFLGGEGYYVVKMSGSGWIKGGAGYATYSSGHEYFIVWATDDRTEPAKKYYWEFPTGYDANQYFPIWRREYTQSSRKACRALPPMGRKSVPHIWTDGPNYEIVHGPYSGATPAQYGSRRKNNGEPGSAFQWQLESGKIADVQAACAAIGAPF